MCRLKFVFLLFILFSTPCFAWWDDEHRVIAIIADNHLSDHTRKQIEQILGDTSLDKIANWADRVKSQQRWRHSKPWHYMNIGSDGDIATYQSVVEGDILWALGYFYKQLKDSHLPLQQRRRALRFFVHFVADIHQPLHVGLPEDRGGNWILVRWFNGAKLQNLHKVWDGLLTGGDLNPAQYAHYLDNASQSQIDKWQNSTFRDWAGESKQLLGQLYRFGAENTDSKRLILGDQYLRVNRPIAERRLLQAGIRLAYYLNRAFVESEQVTQ